MAIRSSPDHLAGTDPEMEESKEGEEVERRRGDLTLHKRRRPESSQGLCKRPEAEREEAKQSVAVLNLVAC